MKTNFIILVVAVLCCSLLEEEVPAQFATNNLTFTNSPPLVTNLPNLKYQPLVNRITAADIQNTGGTGRYSETLVVYPSNALAAAGISAASGRIIINQQTGQYAVINPQSTGVISMSKDGVIMWSNDITEAIPPELLKSRGNKITSMKLIRDELVVDVGFASFSIDKDTGKVKFLGSD